MKRKLKEFTSSGEFEIIDDWNHRHIEDLPYKDAVKRYGECYVESSYTSASSQLKDANGKTPSWKTAVWLKIPGFYIGYWNSENMHLIFCGNEKTAKFKGKKSRKTIEITRHENNTYDITWSISNLITDSVQAVSDRIAVKLLEGEFEYKTKRSEEDDVFGS